MLRDSVCRSFKIACVVALAFEAWPPSVVRAAQNRADRPSIFISEIAWAGSSRSTADEWLELANAGDGPVSVSGWRLEGAGDRGKTIYLPAGASVPAHGVYLIANYAVGDPHTALAVAPDMVTTTVSLANDAQAISLRDADGALVDSAGDGAKPFAGYSSAAKASMVRSDPLINGDQASAWTVATTTGNLLTVDFGTPGLPDLVFAAAGDLGQPNPPTETSDDDAVAASSTPCIAEPDVSETPTSTPDVDSTVATTTPPLAESMASSTTSTLALIDAVAATPSSSQATQSTNSVSSLTSNQIYVRLNETLPNPTDGPEWVEVVNSLPDRTVLLDGLELHDAVGKIMRLSGSLSPDQPMLVVELASARLNNSGDSLYLKTADGTVVDTLTYSESHEGMGWARDAQGAWRETESPTPGAANRITEAVAVPDAKTNASTYQPMETVKSSLKKPTVPKKTAPTIKQSTTAQNTTKTSGKAKASATSTKSVVEIKKTETAKATVKKTAAKTAAAAKPLLKTTLDMLNDDFVGDLRVLLEGTVGSPARFVSGHAFILLNTEGRGLMVRVPTTQKLPAMGTPVRVTGSLKFDAKDLPYLSMAKTDGWSALRNGLATPKPKTDVMLEAPGAEDAWALVAASGTVISVSGKTITMATDGADVAVKIRPGVAYRATRLKAGDVIRVTGVLDATGEAPAILPRNADEIQLVSHAPIKATVNAAQPAAQSTVPGWMPFGAAALAVGAIQGAKSVRGRLKKSAKPRVTANA